MLNRTFGCVRLVWNTIPAWRQARYRDKGVTTSYAQTDRYPTELKRDGATSSCMRSPASRCSRRYGTSTRRS
ncbi:helix-turn-helix domain-containing protein [Microbispora sitophila]|uniref:helix-turn-helix domain-containing protein n=1 Tax=Microbispora sitophila TaxID=2771537 RepID=UPI00384D8463